MKLVTDGENWAIKRWSWGLPYFGFVYFDFEDPHFWWPKTERYFAYDCWTDKQTAEKWLRRLKA